MTVNLLYNANVSIALWVLYGRHITFRTHLRHATHTDTCLTKGSALINFATMQFVLRYISLTTFFIPFSIWNIPKQRPKWIPLTLQQIALSPIVWMNEWMNFIFYSHLCYVLQTVLHSVLTSQTRLISDSKHNIQ